MESFRARILTALEDEWADPSLVLDLQTPHRRLQHVVEAASYWLLMGGGAGTRAELARQSIRRALTSLEGQQESRSGLFLVGDNVLSPPDTSFTINGLTRLARVIGASEQRGRQWEAVMSTVRRIVEKVAPSLRGGGVHTPNHRWELASALAQSAVILGDESLKSRAEQWLAEGIDVQEDGLFSERSPNYAAYVSIPSLVVLAEVLGRPGLLDIVHQNLHVHTRLTDADGNVCTLHSRRQDQGQPFPLAPFEAGYRIAAQVFACTECGRMAKRCGEAGGGDAVELAAAILMGTIRDLPEDEDAEEELDGWVDLTASELSVHRAGEELLIVRGASDVATVGRVCSGINHEPTFCSLRRNGLQLAGLRLARRFFGLGPFRAGEIARHGDEVTLHETVVGSYYQPLEPGLIQPDGAYEASYEGRFAAWMSFGQRARDDIRLETTVRLTRHPDGIEIAVSCIGPSVPLSLELALGVEPASLTGAVDRLQSDLWAMVGPVRLQVSDGEAWILESEGADLSRFVFYEPGEAFRHLNGTDAYVGPRLALAWRSDQRLVLRLVQTVMAEG